MINRLPYDISEGPNGSVCFSRRKLAWDDAVWALRRRGLRWFVIVLAVAYAAAYEAEEQHWRVLGLDPGVVMLGIAAVGLAVGFGTAYLVYRRATESFVFDADRGALRVGRGTREIPFTRLAGAYCVLDRWTHTEQSGAPVEQFEVYVRSGERRIPLALVDNRLDAEELRDKLQRLISGERT